MKQISLVLKTQSGSICYDIDAEARQYVVRTLDGDGKPTGEDEVVAITDPQILSKRLYLIVQAALAEKQV